MIPSPPQTLRIEGSASPADPTKLPDELKGDCFKFFTSPAGQVFMQVLRMKSKAKPVAGLTAHDLIRQYALKEGYDEAVANVTEMIIESNPPEPELTVEEKAHRILMNPAD